MGVRSQCRIKFGARLALAWALLSIYGGQAADIRIRQQDVTQSIVNIHFHEMDGQEALRKLFGSVGVSYEIAPDVQGVVTLDLVNVTFETALQQLTRKLDATYRVDGGIYPIVRRSHYGKFVLHDQDRVVFFGDSPTDNAAYCRDVEDYVLTCYPDLDVRFYNAGLSGDKVSGGRWGDIDRRLTRDVFSRKPTVITVMFGMNDAGYVAFDEKRFEAHKKGYQHIVDRLHAEAPNARIWLFHPSPFDEVTRPFTVLPDGYNRVLSRYSDFVTHLALSNGYGLVYQNEAMSAILKGIDPLDHEAALQMIPDRIHPGWQGNYAMALMLLEEWKADCFSISPSEDSISRSAEHPWTEAMRPVPFKFSKADRLMGNILNSFTLTRYPESDRAAITGLVRQHYTLRIDDRNRGTFSAENYPDGVAMGSFDSPMVEQGAALRDLVDKRNALYFERWKQLASNPSNHFTEATDPLDDQLFTQEHQLAQPKPHKFELVPVD